MSKLSYGSPWIVSTLVAVAATVTASAVPRSGPDLTRSTTPLRLADLTLDRAIHFTAPLYSDWSVSCPIPSSFGLAITEIFGFPFHNALASNESDNYVRRGVVSINQVRVASFLLVDTGNPEKVQFDPPLIVRPGDSLRIELINSPIYPSGAALSSLYPLMLDVPEISVGAWVLYPGEI